MKTKLKLILSISILSLVNAQHFVPSYLSQGDNPFAAMNVNIAGATLNDADLEAGDEIGIFDGELCVGSHVLIADDFPMSGMNPLFMYASSQAPDWSSGIGFTEGNTIMFRVWDGTNDITDVTATTAFGSTVTTFSAQGTAYFKLAGTIALSIEHFSSNIPTEFTISKIYPNPFNPVTNITYDLPENAHVQLEVFDLSGTKVESLINKFQTQGSYNVNWDASPQSSGVFFVKMITGDPSAGSGYNDIYTQKLMLIK